jgi:DNA invertase Pin-like site-specific DNA recombinase
MPVAIYARVSTGEQDVTNQLHQLYRYCEARGWELHREYVDVGLSGAKADRPELEALMRDARSLKFKCVLVWKFDRLFRSVEHMLGALAEFRSLGIDFVSLTESIDTTTPAGKMVFTMLAAVAEFERDLARERTCAGMERARTAGKRIGRPPLALDLARARRLRNDPEHPMSFRQIAKEMRVSVGKLHQALQEPIQKVAT